MIKEAATRDGRSIEDVGLAVPTRNALIQAARARRVGVQAARRMLQDLANEKRAEIERHMQRMREMEEGARRLIQWLARNGIVYKPPKTNR